MSALGRVDPSTADLPVERFAKVDLSRTGDVHAMVRSAHEQVVVNFAARTEVDPVERERSLLDSPGGSAWSVNALAPEEIASACRAGGKYFVQISTDFVFDGTRGPYDEDEPRAPFSGLVSWYGWTKSEGERRSTAAAPDMAVIRISYPYRAKFPAKLDFARWILEMRRKGALPPLYANQQITPTWVPDVTRTLAELLRRRPTGIFHVASAESTSPLEFGRELLTRVEGATPMLAAGLLSTPRPGSGVAPRPIRGGLSSHRCTELGIQVTNWRAGIERLVRADEARQ